MQNVVGVDGCRGGWVAVWVEFDGSHFREGLHCHVYKRMSELLEAQPSASVLAVDIPIGLPTRGSRKCDLEARKLLGRRGSCVFPAPVRSAVGTKTLLEANRISRGIDGRGVAAQAFGIYPKVHEVDEELQRVPTLRSRMIEVHPEVSFLKWSGRTEPFSSKKTKLGLADRVSLIDAEFGMGAFARAHTLVEHFRVAKDDVADAFAAMWTGIRKLSGAAERVTRDIQRDEAGIEMQIWF